MKVLQLGKFFPPVMGGIERVSWELAEGLNAGGVHTDVLCASQTRRTQTEQAPAGYQVMRAGSLGMLLSTAMAPAMVRCLQRLAPDYDVIHVHMPDPMAAVALWCVRPRAKVVVHWHSDVVRQRRALKLYEPLQRWLLRRADAIVATSAPYADSSACLADWREKVVVIPIGIADEPDAAVQAQAAAVRQRFAGRRIVFALGRMAYYKGYEVLIEAAAALPEDCVVLIGGDGELLQAHRDLVAARGLNDRVVLVGQVPDHERRAHYEACDVFCMPSTVRAEAYGVAMVEAMAAGRPVVASDIVGSGVPWVNVDAQTGYNVPVRDAPALATALRRLLDDAPLRARMGDAARRRYRQVFNAELMTRRTHDLYRRLLPAAAHTDNALDHRLDTSAGGHVSPFPLAPVATPLQRAVPADGGAANGDRAAVLRDSSV